MERKKENTDRYEKERSKAPVREWDLGKVPQDEERKRSRERERDREKIRDRSRSDRSKERSEKRRHSSPPNGIQSYLKLFVV